MNIIFKAFVIIEYLKDGKNRKFEFNRNSEKWTKLSQNGKNGQTFLDEPHPHQKTKKNERC